MSTSHETSPAAALEDAAALAASGLQAEAIALLCRAAQSHPDHALLEHAVPWLHREQVLEGLTIEWAALNLLRPMTRMIEPLPVSLLEDDPRRANLEAAEHICRVIAQRFPLRGIPYFALCAVARRAGHIEEAVASAERGYQLEPSAALGLQLGHAYREAGRGSAARLAFTQALRLEPGSMPALRALAELAADEGEWDLLRDALDKARRAGLGEAEARALQAFARWRVYGRDGDLLALLRAARDGDEVARGILERFLPRAPQLSELIVPDLVGETSDVAPIQPQAANTPLPDATALHWVQQIVCEPYQLDIWRNLAVFVAAQLRGPSVEQAVWSMASVAVHAPSMFPAPVAFAHQVAACMIAVELTDTEHTAPNEPALGRERQDPTSIAVSGQHEDRDLQSAPEPPHDEGGIAVAAFATTGEGFLADAALIALVARARGNAFYRPALGGVLDELLARGPLAKTGLRPLASTLRAVGLATGDRHAASSLPLYELSRRLSRTP